MLVDTSQRVPCCDICDPALLDRTRPPRLARPRKAASQTQGIPDQHALQALEEWRAATLSRDYPQAIFGASALLDDTTIDKLTSAGPLTEDEIKQMLKGWIWRHDYEAELCQLLRSLNVVFRPKPKPPKKTRAAHSADTATTLSAPGKRPAPRTDDDPFNTMPPTSTQTTKRARLDDTGDLRDVVSDCETESPRKDVDCLAARFASVSASESGSPTKPLLTTPIRVRRFFDASEDDSDLPAYDMSITAVSSSSYDDLDLPSPVKNVKKRTSSVSPLKFRRGDKSKALKQPTKGSASLKMNHGTSKLDVFDHLPIMRELLDLVDEATKSWDSSGSF
ncbi:hypothetical protein EVJ58_g7964 [Rhodofomes roseus]|uniref:Uncharacterized protein n=1 Tax=Rhodofomes roseus TaxID=34475 RepID=A0A4Y9Y2T0_9APHY|nr:hypothetical protein EVJ58_g7964 [Rhodofomes roseus]